MFAERARDFWRSEGRSRCVRRSAHPRPMPSLNRLSGRSNESVSIYFVCFSRGQLDYILRTRIARYNSERPHRGIGMGNVVLDKSFRPQAHGPIRCRQQLGGLIKSYYREAA